LILKDIPAPAVRKFETPAHFSASIGFSGDSLLKEAALGANRPAARKAQPEIVSI